MGRSSRMFRILLHWGRYTVLVDTAQHTSPQDSQRGRPAFLRVYNTRHRRSQEVEGVHCTPPRATEKNFSMRFLLKWGKNRVKLTKCTPRRWDKKGNWWHTWAILTKIGISDVRNVQKWNVLHAAITNVFYTHVAWRCLFLNFSTRHLT